MSAFTQPASPSTPCLQASLSRGGRKKPKAPRLFLFMIMSVGCSLSRQLVLVSEAVLEFEIPFIYRGNKSHEIKQFVKIIWELTRGPKRPKVTRSRAGIFICLGCGDVFSENNTKQLPSPRCTPLQKNKTKQFGFRKAFPFVFFSSHLCLVALNKPPARNFPSKPVTQLKRGFGRAALTPPR